MMPSEEVKYHAMLKRLKALGVRVDLRNQVMLDRFIKDAIGRRISSRAQLYSAFNWFSLGWRRAQMTSGNPGANDPFPPA